MSTTLHTVTDHLPSTSAVSDAAAAVAELVPEIVRDLELPDVSAALTKSRRTIAGYVPWMSAPTSRRRWVLIGLAAAAAVTVVVVLRRRAGADSDQIASSTPTPVRNVA